MERIIRFIFMSVFLLSSFVFVSKSLAQGGDNALDFESANTGGADGQYVSLGSHSSLAITGDLTIECWVRLESTGINQQILIFSGSLASEAEADNTLYSVNVNPANNISIQHESGPGTDSTPVTSTTTLSAGVWTHVAITRDTLNDEYQIYFNGIAETPVTYGTGVDPSGGTSGNGLLGILSHPVAGFIRDFDGAIDEVRIWSAERSQSEIRSNMNRILAGSESNLIAYWRMYDGTGQTVTDFQSSGNNDGTLGATSASDTDDPAWITSNAPIGEDGAFVISTTPTSVGPTGGDVTVTITSAPDASNNLMVYQFGSVSGAPVTAGETFPTGFDRRSNVVWGVYEIGSVTADLVFDYSNQVGVGDPTAVEILTRVDANDTSWEEVVESSRNDGTRTITLTGASVFAEYAIGGITPDNPLPVELLSFSANKSNDVIQLKWETASEFENLGFEIYRSFSKDGDYDLIATYEIHDGLKCLGNSSTGSKYYYKDTNVNLGNTYFYKLVDVDYNGQKTENGPVMVVYTNSDLEQIVDAQLNTEFVLMRNYPNPFNPQTTIEFNLPEYMFKESQLVSLDVFNLEGKLVKNILNSTLNSGQYRITWNGTDETNLQVSTGIYIYQLRIPALNITQSKRMVFLK